MTMLKDNIEYIKKRQFLVDGDLSAETVDWINFYPAKSGKLTFTISRGGKKISFHSPYDPLQEAERLADKIKVEDNPELAIVFGLGLGYHISSLRNKFGPRLKILIIEPESDILAQILQHIKLADLFDENIFLTCSKDIKDAFNQFKRLFKIGHSDRVVFLEQPVYTREFGNYFDALTEKIKNYVSNALCNFATILSYDDTWLYNNLQNIRHYYASPGINRLSNCFQDKPAIIVAAGPSLDKNISLLHEAKDKAIIIGVGASMKALQRNKITPDFLLTIDASEANYLHFKDFNISNIPLVFSPMTYPQIVAEHKGIKFGVNTGNKITGWFHQYIDDKGLLPTGGSVAHLAFSLAYRMGANPIILIGQDLAFTDNKSHTADYAIKDRIHQNMDFGDDPNYFKIPGYFGDEVWTSRNMFAFLDWYEEAVEFCKDRTVINATEGGAKIRGTVQMPLKEVIEKYCREEIVIGPKIKSLWNDYVPCGANNLVEAMTELIERLKKIRKICTEGIEICQKIKHRLKGNINKNIDRSLLNRLDKIDQQLKNEERVTDLMQEPLQKTVVTVLHKYRNNKDQGNKNIMESIECSSDIYENIKAVSTRYIDYFKEAIEKMREESADESIDKQSGACM